MTKEIVMRAVDAVPTKHAVACRRIDPWLAEVLSGQDVLRDAMRQEVAVGVDLLPAGESADPLWTFTGDKLRQVISDAVSGRDLRQVDVPRLNQAPEASFVVRSLDAVVLVVEANRHRADVVARNLKLLRSLGPLVLGSVVNELIHEVPSFVGKMV